MKKFFTLVFFTSLFSLLASTGLQAQTVYASTGSGTWGQTPVSLWKTYANFAAAIADPTGASGGTPAGTGIPSGTNNILIRSGHIVTLETAHGCKSIIIQSGGQLLVGSGTATRLQIGAGGTGFVYPLVDTVQIDGALGAANDGLYVETGKGAQTVNITGTGTVDILRIRTIGGNSVLNFNINRNINLWQAANYALTLVYTTPNVNDNYTLTIANGATVKIEQPDGFLHNNLLGTNGNYTYLIHGTLDLSANIQTSNNLSVNITAPAPATSSVNLTVDGGLLKLGSGFKADTTAASLGVTNISAINGGVIDGTNTSYFKVNTTTDGVGGSRPLFIGLDPTGTVKQTVGAALIKFPIGLNTSTTPNTASFINNGTTSVYTVGLQSTFSNTPPAQTIPRQWNIAAGTPGSNDTVRLAWTTGDETGSGFTHAGAVYIIHWNGATWDYFQASVSGTGTNIDPYVAKAGGITAFSPYAVTSSTPVPVIFGNINSVAVNNSVKVSWNVQTEINTKSYVVERSSNGADFSAVGTVSANGSSNYSFVDNSPVNGNSFYKVKAVDVNGTVSYSTIVNVGAGNAAQEVVIAPNPVHGKLLNLQLKNLTGGKYTVNIYNSTSQKVFSTVISHPGGSTNKTLTLSSVAKGVYNVHVTNGVASFNKTIIVE